MRTQFVLKQLNGKVTAVTTHLRHGYLVDHALPGMAYLPFGGILGWAKGQAYAMNKAAEICEATERLHKLGVL